MDSHGAIELTTRRVEVADDVELRIIEWVPTGERHDAAFVLVHGLASNAHMWDGVGRRLAEAGHHAVAVDLRGHGLSAKPNTGYDTSTVADDVAELIGALGAERPIVAGQSWGGNVAIELAYRHPGLTAGVVPVDGGFIDLQERFPDWDDCARALAPPRLIGVARSRIEAMMRSGNAHWPPEGIAGSLANFDVRDDGTIAPWLTFERHMAVLRGLWEHRPHERFPHLREPVLWLPADSGEVAWTASKRDALAKAEALLDRSETVWFSPAHHDVHAEQPDKVVEVLRRAVAAGFFNRA